MCFGVFSLSYALVLDQIWGDYYIELYQNKIDFDFMKAHFGNRTARMSQSMSATWN